MIHAMIASQQGRDVHNDMQQMLTFRFHGHARMLITLQLYGV